MATHFGWGAGFREHGGHARADPGTGSGDNEPDHTLITGAHLDPA
jgi:hypothetical protein